MTIQNKQYNTARNLYQMCNHIKYFNKCCVHTLTVVKFRVSTQNICRTALPHSTQFSDLMKNVGSERWYFSGSPFTASCNVVFFYQIQKTMLEWTENMIKRMYISITVLQMVHGRYRVTQNRPFITRESANWQRVNNHPSLRNKTSYSRHNFIKYWLIF